VLDDPVKLTAAAARSLAQLLVGRLVRGRVERTPARAEDRLRAAEIGLGHRPGVREGAIRARRSRW
jgi:hypothetical protein